jgi:hypothetical protein
MRTSSIERPAKLPAIWLAVIALLAAGCTNSDAGVRKAALKASTTPQQKPIKLRYYGGPKYPMYPG